MKTMQILDQKGSYFGSIKTIQHTWRHWAEMSASPRQQTVFCEDKSKNVELFPALVGIDENGSENEFGIGASSP